MILTLRGERPHDIPAIREVIKAAFKAVSHSDQNEHNIVDLLRHDKALSLSRVAEQDGQIIAHLAVSAVTLNDNAPDWYGIGPLAVLPARQNQGVGSKLLHSTLDMLKEMGAAGCVVLGEPGYYQRFGFRSVAGLRYQGVPEEYFMAVCFDGAVPQGSVRYHRAFGE